MTNADVEVGGRSEAKTKWWHCSTQQNNMNITDTFQILVSCKKDGEDLSKQHPPFIYMIPSSVRDIKPEFFKPQVVSIGPLHREDETLQKFEKQKAIYLYHLLDSLNIDSGIILKECLRKVNDSIQKIKGCYGGMGTYTDAKLAEMMVIDACFILQFLFGSEEHGPSNSRNVILNHSISRDLVLLENQIPFFVLQDIFNCTICKSQTCSLNSGILQHLQILSPFKGIKNNNIIATTQPHHILGLLQKSFHPTDNSIQSIRPPCELPNHSVVELDNAGVKFKANKNDISYWPLAIDFGSSSLECFRWFWGHRTLRMPKMCIDDNTELFLRNIIAYEQCTPNVPHYVTSYVSAIDMLLDTKEDLCKLVKSKVFTNNLGSNKDATKMLNSISKQFVFEEFYYMDQWKNLHNYHEGCWPKNIATLKRRYFSSPWNIIALLAGIILFALAVDSHFFCLPSSYTFSHYVRYFFRFLLTSH